jgi:hypothetical protein
MGARVVFRLLVILGCVAGGVGAAAGAAAASLRPGCDDLSYTCADIHTHTTYDGAYTGHDEPSVIFYSSRSGSGNDNTYRLILPPDPSTFPSQDGTGSTWSFQQHPAFWFGMAMCDGESAPEFTKACTPDSDTNIKDSADPSSPDFIGRHSGAAFMEMQFYPPGWVSWPPGVSCSPTKWCAALNIDSFNQAESPAGDVDNNAACLESVSEEPVNFAFITKSGTAHAPAGPIDNLTDSALVPNANTDLWMNPGDQLVVHLHDTSAGFQVNISDLSSQQSGSMTASPANGFAQVIFDPTASTCAERPYAFHPMYATSSEHTRVPWTAHSYNVAYSDEIGHFEYCANVNTSRGTCSGSTLEGHDKDGNFCFDPSSSLLVPIGGCLGTDFDFDGVPYQPSAWPGTGAPAASVPAPVTFSSPTFANGKNFDRLAFETDLPNLERHAGLCDATTGAGCAVPPPGVSFYPMYTTANAGTSCLWREGGPSLPGAVDTFGGTPAAEFGGLLFLDYADGRFLEDNRNIIASNPCPA